jgi:hypothetical protein
VAERAATGVYFAELTEGRSLPAEARKFVVLK